MADGFLQRMKKAAYYGSDEDRAAGKSSLQNIEGGFAKASANLPDLGVGGSYNRLKRAFSTGGGNEDPREFAKTFNPQSNEDVKKMQGMLGLKTDGILGPKTLSALRELQGASSPMEPGVSEESQWADEPGYGTDFGDSGYDSYVNEEAAPQGGGIWSKVKGLGSNLYGKMTDDEGLFQGGQQGRMFGRARDLMGGQPDEIGESMTEAEYYGDTRDTLIPQDQLQNDSEELSHVITQDNLAKAMGATTPEPTEYGFSEEPDFEVSEEPIEYGDTEEDSSYDPSMDYEPGEELYSEEEDNWMDIDEGPQYVNPAMQAGGFAKGFQMPPGKSQRIMNQYNTLKRLGQIR